MAGLPATAHDEGGPAVADASCMREEVLAHVREQFRLHGPLSENREYFGFVYWLDGTVHSAVIRGPVCGSNHVCGLDTSPAARGIPPGAKVLGEWHTHPQTDGSRNLSIEDVLGAYRNRHIRCYMAFYSQPDGDIFTWDINARSVPVAMASRVRLGNFRDDASRPAIIAAQ